MASGLSTLTIGARRWGNAQSVTVASVSASWGVSTIGRLSAVLTARQAGRLGFASLLGLWVLWEHETLGPWGGVVEDVTFDLDRGTVEMGAASFATLLRKRRTSRSFRTQSAPAGSLWLRAMTDVQTDQDLDIDSAAADEDGTLFTVEWRGDDLFQLTDSLATASQHEYDVAVDADRRIAAEFRAQVGADRRGSVLLIEGRDVLGGQIAPTSYDLVNDLLAVSADGDWAAVEHAVVLDGDSLEAYGRHQGVAAYDYTTRRATLVPRAEEDLVTLSVPAIPASLRVAASNRQLTAFTHGDTVRLWSASANAMYDFRVLSRAVDADEGVVTLAGDCTGAT